MKAFLTLLAFVQGVAVSLQGTPSAEAPPRFKITTRRPDDTVAVQAGRVRAVFTVTSPFGISQAVVERLDDHWPKEVVLRLHLKGLSSFRASNGKVRVDAAVSVHEGRTRVRVWKDGKEGAPLDEKSPLWMDIRLLESDGRPAREFPPRDGYFEVHLPRSLFEGQPRSVTLNWIDFYRN